MSKGLYFFINILIYSFIITILNTLSPGSAGLGMFFTLVIGGIIFAIFALAAEPLLAFFKFPVNFWGLLVIGFILNLIFFAIMSSGVFPVIALVEFNQEFFGEEFKPLPLYVKINNAFVSSLIASFFTTLLQILTRKLGKK